jgi:hypothetical protein
LEAVIGWAAEQVHVAVMLEMIDSDVSWDTNYPVQVFSQLLPSEILPIHYSPIFPVSTVWQILTVTGKTRHVGRIGQMMNVSRIFGWGTSWEQSPWKTKIGDGKATLRWM